MCYLVLIFSFAKLTQINRKLNDREKKLVRDIRNETRAGIF